MTTHVESAIEKYFAGRIEVMEERDALFGHLDRCDGCRQRFDELARMQRALSGGGVGLPAAELHLIGRTVIASAAPVRVRSWSWLRIAAPLVAVAAAVLLFLRPADEVWTAKGGEAAAAITLEALCFELESQTETVLRTSGDCPAPSFVKLVYASPRKAGHFHVVARAGGESRMEVTLDDLGPRSPIPGHVQLEPGETIEISTIEDGEERPVLSIRGVSR